MENPLVSITLLSYNRDRYIAKSIDSILAQTYQNWELVIVDAGSTDNTDKIIKKYQALDNRIIYHKKDKKDGVAHDRNVSLGLCHGEYIAVLDSDDYWLAKNKLERQVDILLKNPKCVIVGTQVITVDQDDNILGKIINPESNDLIRESILMRNPFVHSSVMFRATACRQLGGYDQKVVIGEEYDLWLRMCKTGEGLNLSDEATAYRIHTGSACVSDRLGGALDTKKIVMRYGHDYPGYSKAMTKAYLRIIYSFYQIFIDRFRIKK